MTPKRRITCHTLRQWTKALGTTYVGYVTVHDGAYRWTQTSGQLAHTRHQTLTHAKAVRAAMQRPPSTL
jgi:hypothetical protein